MTAMMWMFTFLMEPFVTAKEAPTTSAGSLYFIRLTLSNVFVSRKHQCLSSARGSRADKVPDLQISQNARPDGALGVSEDMEAYFSLNEEVMMKPFVEMDFTTTTFVSRSIYDGFVII